MGNAMSVIWAEQALTAKGWARDVKVEIDDAGRISGVTPGSAAQGTRVATLLPAPVNVHSHAFQRAMAGLTERRGPDPRDTFWTWRQLMFAFLDRLTPDDVQAIAAFVQMEMLEAGYACNAEFHYLHHAPGGAHYDDLAEMSGRIVSAAEETGIGLTLLPVHYQYGGCDRRALGPGQIRFGNDIDRFAELWAKAGDMIAGHRADAVIGVAPHSLRAVSGEGLAACIEMAGKRPLHMHLAEQLAEVEEVRAAWRRRPVEHLLEVAEPRSSWCLIHCTQMLPHETVGLAETGAVAGLCPLTESNLGDGIFDGMRWADAGGRIAIGSDSNIRIALAEELRVLDHSQRLRDHTRAAFATPEQSTGRRLYEEILRGGAHAAGRGRAGIAIGNWADLLGLDGGHVDLEAREGDTLLDCWIFAGDDRMVRDVWSAGRHLVSDGQHMAREAITQRYRTTIAGLRDAL